MSETPARISKPVPLIGEHGYEILVEFGYTVSEIEEFEKNKVITVERISDE
jgi:crotonobetainyl-CoA:carnitine CoA-transferase CaiB-like acyl-CoA transferase